MTIKEKVLKEQFMIMPLPEADNLKHIRKSAERIIETRYSGLGTIEKSIDLTLAEVGKVIDEYKEKLSKLKHIDYPLGFTLLQFKELKQKLGIK